jgi:hypothetical protein
MKFKNKTLVIATMHQKEQVIAPILASKLGVNCIVDTTINTDLFGTFSGEKERLNSVLDTLRAKCKHALKATNAELAIASEGSFGSHPYSFFSSVNEEFLMFIDPKNKLEIVEKVLSLETNLNGAYVTSENELLEFALRCKFPSHGLIIKDHDKNYQFIQKGICSKKDLLKQYRKCMITYGFVYVETDMRAMYNPTRMTIIQRATQKLVDKITTSCTVCGTPGFGIVDVVEGLPCEYCNAPTKSILYQIYQCSSCSHTKKMIYPSGNFFEDPMYSDTCNP